MMKRCQSFVFAFLLSLPPAQAELVCDDPNEFETQADAAAHSLLSSGRFAQVLDGVATLKKGSSDTDFGTNPEGVYLSYSFPCGSALPEPYWKFAWPSSCSSNGTNTSNFVIGAADAIVFYGCTPPPVKYFGYDMIIRTRPAASDEKRRTQVLGTNFGDALNYRKINTSESSSRPFSAAAIVVHTADGATFEPIVDAYVAAGAPAGAANLLSLDAGLLRFQNRSTGRSSSLTNRSRSSSASADILFSIIRASLPVDAEHLDAYAGLEWPVRFFMAWDDTAPIQPMVPTKVARQNSFDEVTGLSDVFVTLQDLVVANWTSSSSSSSSSSPPSSYSAHDPRTTEPGCFAHIAFYVSADCSGAPRAIEGLSKAATCPAANATEPTCAAYRNATGASCESFHDSCCFCPGCWGSLQSARLCDSEESLNDAVTSCPFNFSSFASLSPMPPNTTVPLISNGKAPPFAPVPFLSTSPSLLFPSRSSRDDAEVGDKEFLSILVDDKAKIGFYDDWEELLVWTDWNYDAFIAPTRDAMYTIPTTEVPLYNGTSIVVVGVNHRITQNASYQMLGLQIVNSEDNDSYRAFSVSDDEMIGSAQRYFEGVDHNFTQAQINSLWAWDFVPPGGCASHSDAWRPFCTEIAADLYIGKEIKGVFLGERIYSVEATGMGPRQDQTIAAVGLAFFDSADGCGMGPPVGAPEACGPTAWDEAVAEGFADGCCGCLYGACPTDSCSSATEAPNSSCLAALSCPGVCESCEDGYQAWFCEDGILHLGLDCNSRCGNSSSRSSCQSYADENDATIGTVLMKYRNCVEGLRMNCTAEDVLQWSIFDNPTCDGECSFTVETESGKAMCNVDGEEASDDDNIEDDWFTSDDDGQQNCPLSEDDLSKQEIQPCQSSHDFEPWKIRQAQLPRVKKLSKHDWRGV